MGLEATRSYNGLKDFGELGGGSCSTINPLQFSGGGSLWQPVNYDNDMCRVNDGDDLMVGVCTNLRDNFHSRDGSQKSNPMCEPNDDRQCSKKSPNVAEKCTGFRPCQHADPGNECLCSGVVDCGFTVPTGQSEPDDDEVTKSNIRAFLDKKMMGVML